MPLRQQFSPQKALTWKREKKNKKNSELLAQETGAKASKDLMPYNAKEESKRINLALRQIFVID